MIETAIQPQAHAPRAVLIMARNERMGGSVPVWTRNPEAGAAVAARLGGAQSSSFDSALSYAAAKHSQPREFGFGDLVDMVNPLHHIPLVGPLYRHVTGDDIRPAARIIGGTVFGGPVGGAASLANVIVEHESGRDIAGNVIALASGNRGAAEPAPQVAQAGPEERLSLVLAQAQSQHPQIPETAAAFAAPERNEPMTITWNSARVDPYSPVPKKKQTWNLNT